MGSTVPDESNNAFLSYTSEEEAELNEAFTMCFNLIDHPPDEYRIIKQAVQGLVCMWNVNSQFQASILQKIIQVVQDSRGYRSNPRRYAVRSLGQIAQMAPENDPLIATAVDILSKMLKRDVENSQFVRKAAFCALSRIGRRHPRMQNHLISLFTNYSEMNLKSSQRWGILIGMGRMSQTNPTLRAVWAPKWIEACRSTEFRIRWAGIKGLGHACCSTGNVINDPNLEQITFHYGVEFLKYGKLAEDAANDPVPAPDQEDSWKTEDVYLVQYAAVSSLGLLLRANPDEWWPKLSPVLAEVMVNPRYAAMVKASVMLTYGKLSFYMSNDNPFYAPLQELLFTLCTYDNVLISEPACYALVNFSLTHNEIYPKVKAIMRENINGGLSKADDNALLYHLKSWCKMLSKRYTPVLNLCANSIFNSSYIITPITTGPSFSLQNNNNYNNNNSSRQSTSPNRHHSSRNNMNNMNNLNNNMNNMNNMNTINNNMNMNNNMNRGFVPIIPPNQPIMHNPYPPQFMPPLPLSLPLSPMFSNPYPPPPPMFSNPYPQHPSPQLPLPQHPHHPHLHPPYIR